MIAYVLLTHGAKPTGSLKSHPAATQQLANLKAFSKGVGHDFQIVVHDYARSISGIHSLPNLRRILDEIRAQEAGAMVIDDISRLFRACEIENRQCFLTELQPSAGRIIGVRQKGVMSDLTEVQTALIASGALSAKFEAPNSEKVNKGTGEGREQTRKATKASTQSRGSLADEKAREIVQLKAELEKIRDSVTLKELAEEANLRHLVTSRGKPWTAPGVWRALQRQSETENDKNSEAG